MQCMQTECVLSLHCIKKIFAESSAMFAAYVLTGLWAITSLHSDRAIVTHECAQDPDVNISASLSHLLTDRRLHYTGGRPYKPRRQQSPTAFLVALLLLRGGVETNPGPQRVASSLANVAFRLGVLNARSAVNKTALIRDIITDQRLDLLAVTETWMKASHPAAITRHSAGRIPCATSSP